MYLAARRSLVTLACWRPSAVPASPGSPTPVPYEMFRLPNGLTVIVHRGPTLPRSRRRKLLVPRGLGPRDARAHRLRAPVRAPDVRGLEERAGRRVRPLARGGGRQQQRLDARRPHQLLRGRAGERAGAAALPRVRPHGLPARHAHRDDRRRPARRRARTSAARATRTSPTARPRTCCRRAVPEGPPVLLAGDRLRWPTDRREPAGRGRLLPRWYGPANRQPRDRGRRRRQGSAWPRWRSGSPTCPRASRSIR